MRRVEERTGQRKEERCIGASVGRERRASSCHLKPTACLSVLIMPFSFLHSDAWTSVPCWAWRAAPPRASQFLARVDNSPASAPSLHTGHCSRLHHRRARAPFNFQTTHPKPAYPASPFPSCKPTIKALVQFSPPSLGLLTHPGASPWVLPMKWYSPSSWEPWVAIYSTAVVCWTGGLTICE